MLQAETETSVSTSQVAMLECMIVDWNLFGDGNKLVPLFLERGQGQSRIATKNTKAIAKLPMEYAIPVLQAIDALSRKDAVQDPDGFFDSANEPSPES